MKKPDTGDQARPPGSRFICLLLIWLLAVITAATVGAHAYREEQVQARRIAALVAQAVDADLRIGIAALRVLAALPSIDNRDFADWRAVAGQVRTAHTARFVALVDSNLHLVASADLPPGATARRLAVDRLRRMTIERDAAISDRFVGSLVSQSMVAIAVPVLRSHGALGRVEMVFPTERFAAPLARVATGEVKHPRLCDSQGVLIASTAEDALDPARACGRADAIEYVAAVPWTVRIDVAEGAAARRFWRSWATLAVFATALLGTALLLADRPRRSLISRTKHRIWPTQAAGQPEADAASSNLPAEAGPPADESPLAQEGCTSSELLPQRLDPHGQALLAMALETAGLGDWSIDLVTGQADTSPLYDACLGHREGVAGWTLDRFLDQVHPDERTRVEAGLLHSVCTGATWRDEFRIVWPDGSQHWLAAAGHCLPAAGAPQRLLGVVMDITPQREALRTAHRQVQLEAENGRLEDQMLQRGRSFAGISHELRTPLNAILGFAQLLRREPGLQDSPTAQWQLDHIADAGYQLLQLVGDVLDIDRIQEGRLRLQPEDLDCGALAIEVAEMMRPLAEQASVMIVLQVRRDLPSARLDPLRTRQILYNLLSNAVKFSGLSTQVTLRVTTDEDSWIVFEVEDQGPGIATEDQSRLFQAYVQLPEGMALGSSGAGLGLALTRELVVLQGGNLSLISQVGHGCTFTVMLPLRHPRLIPVPEPSGAARDDGGAGDVVDPMPDVS